MIDTQAELPFVFAQYTWRELGKTDEWYRTQCRELLNDRAKIKRELDLVWPLSGVGSVFTEDILDELRGHQRPVTTAFPIALRDGKVPPGLEILWVEPPDTNVPYVVGVDTASGEDRDYTAFVFCHPFDMRAVGYMRTNTTDTESIRHVAQYVLAVLFRKSVVVVERNYLGLALLNFLLKECAMEPRLFYVKKEKVATRTLGQSGRSISIKRPVREYGVLTDKGNREGMIRILFQVVEELPHLVGLEVLQSEIRTLQRKASGKVEHRAGFHDDVLFGFLIAQWADRHDQGVLRELLARAGGEGRAAAAARVAVLNVPEGGERPLPEAAVDPATGEPETRTFSLQDYVARADAAASGPDAGARRRRAMADAISALNTRGGDEIPL
jgi:hypothetical protein